MKEINALADELTEIGTALWSTNALRGRRVKEIANSLRALASAQLPPEVVAEIEQGHADMLAGNAVPIEKLRAELQEQAAQPDCEHKCRERGFTCPHQAAAHDSDSLEHFESLASAAKKIAEHIRYWQGSPNFDLQTFLVDALRDRDSKGREKRKTVLHESGCACGEPYSHLMSQELIDLLNARDAALADRDAQAGASVAAALEDAIEIFNRIWGHEGEQDGCKNCRTIDEVRKLISPLAAQSLAKREADAALKQHRKDVHPDDPDILVCDDCRELAALAAAQLPQCVGYPVCDGDLPGERHSEGCPARTDADKQAEKEWAAAQLPAARKETK